MDPEEDQARLMAVIEPLLHGLHTVFYDAVAKYQGEDYSDAVRAEHSDRTVANIVYDHSDKGWRVFEDTIPGVKFLNSRGLHVLNFRDQVVLRLKQVDGLGLHSNVATGQQQDYDDGQPIPDLPPCAIRLYAGYQMDAAGLGIERVMIVRQIGSEVFWTAQIVVIDDAAVWTDITPRRLGGTERTDFDAQKARRRRR